MRAYQRLLRYVNVNTQSSERGRNTPSSENQFRLARILAKEMTRLGLEKVYTDLDGGNLSDHARAHGYRSFDWNTFQPVPIASETVPEVENEGTSRENQN